MLGLGVAFSTGNVGSLGWQQRAIAQSSPDALLNVTSEMPLAFVVTAGSNVRLRTTPGYPTRFSEVSGSGALVLRGSDVVGYYFTVSDLRPEASYAYHLHRTQGGSIPASCEGDKGLVAGEVGGSIMVNLGAIAPLEVNNLGTAIVGSATAPAILPEPVPLAEIGYVNIHPAPEGNVGSGTMCANVRLNAGGFVR